MKILSLILISLVFNFAQAKTVKRSVAMDESLCRIWNEDRGSLIKLISENAEEGRIAQAKRERTSFAFKNYESLKGCLTSEDEDSYQTAKKSCQNYAKLKEAKDTNETRKTALEAALNSDCSKKLAKKADEICQNSLNTRGCEEAKNELIQCYNLKHSANRELTRLADHFQRTNFEVDHLEKIMGDSINDCYLTLLKSGATKTNSNNRKPASKKNR